MFKISVLLLMLFSFCVIDAYRNTDSCPLPKLKNGRVRPRQRGRMVRFFCLPGFTLVGNRYASCRFGSWEEEIPVCVKPGCDMRDLENGIQWRLHDDAWIISFCLADYELKGSPVIYCDGQQWNGTFPTCIDTKNKPQLSCDFEKDLCGWTDDELHDFDWRRLNRRTPSSFLRTGPSYDHTLGDGKAGYYMYIESTSRKENETARIISPIYPSELTENGCFSFWYHMFGRTIGGLKVYQKPDGLFPSVFFLAMSEENKKKYTLFEKWGNQGDIWLRHVSRLTNFNESFQIVIEGIRGSSFTSDIAIDDVSILQGNACDVLLATTTTPLPPPYQTCAGRCDLDLSLEPPGPGDECGCSISCATYENCCPDFFDLCLFPDNGSTDVTVASPKDSTHELPQTQKLVAANATIPELTTATTTVKTTSTTVTTPPTTKPTTLPTTKATTQRVATTTQRDTTTTKTTVTKIPTTVKRTVKTTTPVIKTTRKIVETTTKLPVTTKVTTKIPTKVATALKTTKITPTTTMKPTTDKFSHMTKYEKEQYLKHKGQKLSSQPNTGVNTTALTWAIVLLICACAVSMLAWRYRGARGQVLLARLRGRAASDSEVRYLSADTDD